MSSSSETWTVMEIYKELPVLRTEHTRRRLLSDFNSRLALALLQEVARPSGVVPSAAERQWPCHA